MDNLSLNKTVICCKAGDRHFHGFNDMVYSPLLYSLGPGTKLTGRFPARNNRSFLLPGFDVSKFAGGVPISAAANQISSVSGKYGVMLHGSKFSKQLAERLSCPAYIPVTFVYKANFKTSIAETDCPLIRPVCSFVKYINGEKTIEQISSRQMSELINKNRVKIYFSDAHKCMYGSIKLNSGFGFLLFDTAKTITDKCRFAESLNKTPVLYYQDLSRLIQAFGLQT